MADTAARAVSTLSRLAGSRPIPPAPTPSGGLAAATAAAGARSTTPTPPGPPHASTLFFTFTVDDVSGATGKLDIGAFTGIDGLSASYEVKTYAEGGENGFVHQLPGRLTYTNVKLTRPLGSPHLSPLTKWFRDLAANQGLSKPSASIVAMDGNRNKLAQWDFTGVWPVKYTGPSFSTDSGKMALEVFEFAHEGFVEVSPQ
jgi:phage tail-like protein